MRSLFLVATLLIWNSTTIFADPITDNNKVLAPPLYAEGDRNCTAELLFKPLANIENHAYVVVTGPNGSQLELRGGPEKGGPTGNPQSCAATNHPWGAVVAYIGKHGLLAEGVHSPDGNVSSPSARVEIGAGAQSNVCKMANCMMTVMKSLGASCENYILGVAKMRNSNTIVSQALASCGVPDPLPNGLTAAGWGESWFWN